ncbi:hypothetical protein [Bacillus sp. 165]|uniref:hypothetical protein n=1 Tax=Bacillus sp. 165 TaxID=1529117 RepID=UPI001ADD2DF9|nr:hypothetical protein [Bacillus sp. 165]MBO9128776.1 hypothetical protein [Bacillus sp. 165]
MKNEILRLVPETVRQLLQKEVEQGDRHVIDLVLDEVMAYKFVPEETVPCIMAAYYVYESTSYSEEMDEANKLRLVFHTAVRSAMKLLSYGKYKAERSESGWMKYTQ